jgi:hypothetical protein
MAAVCEHHGPGRTVVNPSTPFFVWRPALGRSRTRSAKTTAITKHSELTDVLIRLMLSVNDIALASDANDEWASATAERRVYRKAAARMYFIRVLMGHVYEGLTIIEHISRVSDLRAAVDRCDAQTVEAFQSLDDFVRSPEMKILDRFRNRAAFHYDRQLPERHVREIALQSPDAIWSYSMGSEPLDWRFELAEAVMDRIVIREVFGLNEPRGPERTRKTEEIATRIQEISILFTNFAAHFVWHHLK